MREIENSRDAAYDSVIVLFGRFLGVAGRFSHALGQAMEDRFGISHVTYEVLLIVARSDRAGVSMRTISREQVLTTGGVTRAVDRMEAAGLLERTVDPTDGRSRLVRLTQLGERTTVEVSRWHRANLEKLFAGALPPERRKEFSRDIRILSRAAMDVMTPLP